MKVFISGGCKNGKSFYAERVAKYQAAQKLSPLYYIATMISTGEEDDKRIKSHIAEREGMGFITIEEGRDIKNILCKVQTCGSFILDSVTALLSNEMFPINTNVINENAHIKTANELLYLFSQIENMVIVSDYIYSDAMEYDKYTDIYRKNLAYIDRKIANEADVVIEVSFANIIVHKDEKYFCNIKDSIF